MSIQKLYRVKKLHSGEIVEVRAGTRVLALPADAAVDCPTWVDPSQSVLGMSSGTYVVSNGGTQILAEMDRRIDDCAPGEEMLVHFEAMGQGDGVRLAGFWPCEIRPGEVGRAGDVIDTGDHTYAFVTGVDDARERGVMLAMLCNVQIDGGPVQQIAAFVNEAGRLVLGELPAVPAEVMKSATAQLEARLGLPRKDAEALAAEFEPEPMMSYTKGWLWVARNPDPDADAPETSEDGPVFWEYLTQLDDDTTLLLSAVPTPPVLVGEGWTVEPRCYAEGEFLPVEGRSMAVHRVEANRRHLIGIVE